MTTALVGSAQPQVEGVNTAVDDMELASTRCELAGWQGLAWHTAASAFVDRSGLVLGRVFIPWKWRAFPQKQAA